MQEYCRISFFMEKGLQSFFYFIAIEIAVILRKNMIFRQRLQAVKFISVLSWKNHSQSHYIDITPLSQQKVSNDSSYFIWVPFGVPHQQTFDRTVGKIAFNKHKPWTIQDFGWMIICPSLGLEKSRNWEVGLGWERGGKREIAGSVLAHIDWQHNHHHHHQTVISVLQDHSGWSNHNTRESG